MSAFAIIRKEMRSVAQALLGENYYRLLVWQQTRGLTRSEPVLVYQMGKVGSRSVVDSLQAERRPFPVIHVHTLTETGIERGEVKRRGARRGTADHLRNIYLRRAVDAHRFDTTWRIISLVRDPVARNVSSFFHNLPLWTPASPDSPVEELTERFIGDFDHERPLRWFDEELRPVFSIDAYGTSFRPDRGFAEIEGDHARLLVIRCEDLSRVGGPAIADFLGLPGFELVSSNLGKAKDYRASYETFLAGLRIPDALLDAIYASRYMKHFYSPGEIAGFRARWGGTPEARSARSVLTSEAGSEVSTTMSAPSARDMETRQE